MPTKHIDDQTAAQLDDLYVRCVTLTQQPVKEVEVLRLAISHGLPHLTDDRILASLAVRDSVWQTLAAQVWAEVTAHEPTDSLSPARFEALAGAHSPTWQRFPSAICRQAIQRHLTLQLDDDGDTDEITAADGDMSEAEWEAARARDTAQARELLTLASSLINKP